MSRKQVNERNANEPFAAERSRGTNRQTGEQMTHWAMLNKKNLNLVALLNISLFACTEW